MCYVCLELTVTVTVKFVLQGLRKERGEAHSRRLSYEPEVSFGVDHVEFQSPPQIVPQWLAI